MSNYRIKYNIITNNIKCQFELHHCDGLDETIEMDILFVCTGVRMKKIEKIDNITGSHISRSTCACAPRGEPSLASCQCSTAHKHAPGDAGQAAWRPPIGHLGIPRITDMVVPRSGLRLATTCRDPAGQPPARPTACVSVCYLAWEGVGAGHVSRARWPGGEAVLQAAGSLGPPGSPSFIPVQRPGCWFTSGSSRFSPVLDTHCLQYRTGHCSHAPTTLGRSVGPCKEGEYLHSPKFPPPINRSPIPHFRGRTEKHI
jgi:hypothetical protein